MLVHSIDWALEWMIFTREIKKATIKRMIQVNEDHTKSYKDSAQARKALIGSYAEKVIAHAYANGGSCCHAMSEVLSREEG